MSPIWSTGSDPHISGLSLKPCPISQGKEEHTHTHIATVKTRLFAGSWTPKHRSAKKRVCVCVWFISKQLKAAKSLSCHLSAQVLRLCIRQTLDGLEGKEQKTEGEVAVAAGQRRRGQEEQLSDITPHFCSHSNI